MKDALEWAKGQLISIIITACLTLGTNGLYRKMTGSFIEGWTFALLPIFVLLLSEVFISLLQIKPHRYKSYIEELSIFFEYCGEEIFVTKKYRVRALRRNLNKMYHRIMWFSDEKLEIKVLTEGFFVETIPNNDMVREFYIVFPRTLKLFETIDFEFKILGDNKGRKFKNYYWYDVISPTGKLKIDVNVASKYRENRLVLKEFRENMDGNTREKEVETLGNYTWFVKRPKLNYSYVVSWKWKILSWSNSMKETEQTGYPSIDKPWLKYYSEEAINAPLPECSIYEYMYENNKDYPSDIAINYMGRKITYGELFESIDKTAAAFIKAGVKEKEIVTVALPSIPEALYCVYALNKIGAVANMIHPLAGKEETINYINEVKSRVVVIFDKAFETIADSVSDTTVEKIIVASPKDELPFALKAAYSIKVRSPKLDGKVFCSWKSFIKEGKETEVKAVDRNCHETAIISHTGGTTGEPKGCMISDYSTNAEIWQVGKTMGPSRQECMMAVLPPFVNYSLTNGMLEPLAFGMKLVLFPKYEPLKFADYVKKYKVNHINTIPAYCEAMLQIPHIENYDLSSLKYIVYGGEGMTNDVEMAVNTILKKCGCKYTLKKGLGMTEVTSAASATFDSVNDTESVGIPFPKMNIKTIDIETGDEKTYGEEGEICISGPTLMLGYYKNIEATEELIKLHDDKKRWIHTGDLGYINEDGVLFITGRIKRIFMTKGEDGQVTKMFPDRIEKAINKHPSVSLSRVVGIKDADRIHLPKAFVELKPECEATEELKTEIIQQCKEELPDYMVPVEIEYISEIPRTSRGKVDYRVLEKI